MTQHRACKPATNETYPNHPSIRRVLNAWKEPHHFTTKPPQDQLQIWMDSDQFGAPNMHMLLACYLTEASPTLMFVTTNNVPTSNGTKIPTDMTLFISTTSPPKLTNVFHLSPPEPSTLHQTPTTQDRLARLAAFHNRADSFLVPFTSPTTTDSLHKARALHNNSPTITKRMLALSSTLGTFQRTLTPSSSSSLPGARARRLPKGAKNKLPTFYNRSMAPFFTRTDAVGSLTRATPSSVAWPGPRTPHHLTCNTTATTSSNDFQPSASLTQPFHFTCLTSSPHTSHLHGKKLMRPTLTSRLIRFRAACAFSAFLRSHAMSHDS